MANMVVTPEYVQSLGEDIRRMVIRKLTPKERLAGLTIEDRLAGLAIEDRLVGVDLASIEEYLRQKMHVDNKVATTKKPKTTPKKRKEHKS